MYFKVKFSETEQSFTPCFGEVHEVSDNGYERGYAEGESVGYEKGYADMKSRMDAELDTISEGLDNILTIQEELLAITFTIDEYGTIYTLNAVEGMTWREFADSKYNTCGVTIADWGAVYLSVSCIYYEDGMTLPEDVIIADTNYFVM